MKVYFAVVLGVCVMFLASCANISHIPKKIWGSSVAHLEQGRSDAHQKSFECTILDCYQVLLDFDAEQFFSKEVAEKEEKDQAVDVDEEQEKYRAFIDRDYYVFQYIPEKGLIVFMGIPGAVDTTEVGVFLVPEADGITRVDVVSLSSLAKRRAAKDLYRYLEGHFSAVSDLEVVR